MMSSEEDTECFGLYDKLLIHTSNSEKNIVGGDRNTLIISNSNSNSNSSSIISNRSSITNKKCNQPRLNAGEQGNNCYSSIPNFSFRPSSFMSSASAGTAGLYGTLLNQTQSAHFVGGLFGPNGFGSAKMLNEILGRQMKQAQDATSGLPTSLVDNAMLTAAMESATSVELLSASINSGFNSSKLLNNNCMTHSDIGDNAISRGGGGGCGGSVLNNNNDSISSNSMPVDTGENQKAICDRLDESESILPAQQQQQQQTVSTHQQHKQQQNNLAHHMLRNILQGKKDLIALDQELRSVINNQNKSENLKQNTSGGSSYDSVTQDNNNLISKSKNNASATNNNNNGSTNRNLGNAFENRSTAPGVSNSSKSITHSCNNSAISNLIGSVGDLMSTLGSCPDVKIKSEPNAPTTPTSIGNNICNTELNNNSESGRVSKNSKVKSSENFSVEEHAAISEVAKELDFSEMQQNQQISQSACHSLIDDIVTKKEAEDLLEDDLMVLSSRSDIESIGSQSNSDINELMHDSAKEDQSEELEKDASSIADKAEESVKPIILDMKRARVENIVSSMQSSPSSHHQMNLQVNGCKKRKLYQPQQHAMERYAAAAAGLNFGLNMQSFILEEDDGEDMESPQIQQKRVQKNALKSQLRTMQEQLAEMQQKYVQLCSRMEQESEYQEIDDTVSECPENDGNHDVISPGLSLSSSTNIRSLQRPLSSSPPLYPPKPKRHAPVKPLIANTPPMLAQIMSKMITAKIHSPIKEPSNFPHAINQKSSLLQTKPHVPEDHNDSATHSSISNAASMYLGQHFLVDHDIRRATKSDEQHERQQQQQRKEQQQQQKQHENQRRLEQEQKEKFLKQKELQKQHQKHQNQLRESQELRHQPIDVRLLESQTAGSLGTHLLSSHSQQRSEQSQQVHTNTSTQSSIKSEISEKFNMLRSHSSSTVRMSGSDLEGLADILKSEITTSLSALVDTIVTRFVHQRRLFNKQSQSVAAAADQLNKDLMMASHILDRKSPRTKVANQLSSNCAPTASASLVNTSVSNLVSSQSGNCLHLNSNKKQTVPTTSSFCNSSSTIGSHPSYSVLTNHLANANGNYNCSIHIAGQKMNSINLPFSSPSGMEMQMQHAAGINCPLSQSDKSSNNFQSPHLRSSPSVALFQAPKTPQSMSSAAAASLYNSIGIAGSGPHTNPMNSFCMAEPKEQNVEQNEALSLVVTPKKKRHKVTDTRITPRTVSRILAQDGVVGHNGAHNLAADPNHVQNTSSQQNTFISQTPPVNNSNISAPTTSTTPSKNLSPRPNLYHPPAPPMMSVTLPTSVAIPNPSLHESQVFSPYSPFFNPHHGPHGSSHLPPAAAQMHHMKMSSSPPGLGGLIENRESPPLPHPPTMLHPALLAAAHHGNSPDYSAHLRAAMDAQDRNSDCNSADLQFDGIQPTISFLKQQIIKSDSLTPLHSSTLTPMHLRKAKLMFFWVRYPSSAVLKMYFPDIKFNKNNTAQLVKWFSNFREFYYIQMEKYARQAVTEGVKNGDDLHIGGDSELYRVLNLHYNRNNHIEVPSNFRFVVEQTLREFFRAIQGGKDTEQSWKKSIYKIISRMDDPVPEYFKSPNFLEQLE